ncbi:MAG TPA: hypothetical protein VFT95_09570 [Micromonosporaceae bacterium]|nr:hypothetical protein [Micromonosporaceae bacterium]
MTAMVAACVGGGIFLAAPPALAADEAAPVLTELTLSTDAVSVAGVELVPVTVSVRLTDETGVEVQSIVGDVSTPGIRFEREGAGPDRAEYAELTLTSGTPQDGVWSAVVQVPSTWDGHWETSNVTAWDAAQNKLEVDPRTLGLGATLDVTGTHQPAVTMRFVPDPLIGDGPLTVRGRVYDSETGEGLARQPIYFGYDNTCIELGGGSNGTTAADGTYSRTYRRVDLVLQCVGISRPSNISIANSYIVVASDYPRIRPAITITADRTAVRPGTKVTISGVVRPSMHSVQLQQLGRAWRTVGSALPDQQGRFSFAVTPRADGLQRYRVVVPNEDPDLVGVSNVIQVRVGSSGQGGGGGGEGLPITGSAAAPLAGGALVLILAGVVLMRLGRRRPAGTAG